MEKTWIRQGERQDTNTRGGDDDPRNKMSMDLIYAPSLYEMTPRRMTTNTKHGPRICPGLQPRSAALAAVVVIVVIIILMRKKRKIRNTETYELL